MGVGGSAVKNPPANVRDMGLIPGPEEALEKEMVAHSRILSWEIILSYGQSNLADHSPWGHKRVGHDLVT